MNEERRQILHMLAENKITADEAERLLDAVESDRPEPEARAALRPKNKPRYLRMMMNYDDGGDGEGRINVRVPLQLLRAGVRLTALVPPRALTKANEELEKAGYPMNLDELKPKDLEALIDNLDDVAFDMDDPGSRMQIYCE